MTGVGRIAGLAGAAVMAARAAAAGSAAIVPGEVRTPHPTLIHLAVVWPVRGDDNRNAACTVRFRNAGTTAWHDGLPLRRVPAGTNTDAWPVRSWPETFSGSLFDLASDTSYEIALALRDPDGGSTDRVVRARTRPIPRASADAVTRPVTPATIAGAGGPGDVLLLAPGSYGVFTVTRDGEPGRPLVYRSPDGAAVFERISLAGRHDVILEGLTVRNPAWSEDWPTPPQVQAVVLAGARNCAVRRCTIESVYGITAYLPGATDCHVADNTVRGITRWTVDALGSKGHNLGEGIEITGSGNVICHNRVAGFRDGISFMEDDLAAEQICNDIYLNDITEGADDGIEADFAMGNCRIVRNRLTNCYVGLSSQPGLGGPTYFIRNVMYNLVYSPAKLHRGSMGDVYLHNTVVKMGDGLACQAGDVFDHALVRNNLIIGGPSATPWHQRFPPGLEMAVNLPHAGPDFDLDYDALGARGLPCRGVIGGQWFDTFDQMRRGPRERHAVRVDMDVFRDVAFPASPVPGYPAPDLRPVPGATVVDAGARLANVNDDFRGSAPDIGAYEEGDPLPAYGPRPPGADDSTP